MSCRQRRHYTSRDSLSVELRFTELVMSFHKNIYRVYSRSGLRPTQSLNQLSLRVNTVVPELQMR